MSCLWRNKTNWFLSFFVVVVGGGGGGVGYSVIKECAFSPFFFLFVLYRLKEPDNARLAKNYSGHEYLLF